MSEPVLVLEKIQRTFLQGSESLPVLRGCSLSIAAGERVALIGPSGSGKSTLLQIAGLLEPPDAGEIRIAGRLATGASDGVRTALRREMIGFVYQFHHLLPEFSACENIVLPQMIAGVSKEKAEKEAETLLQAVGLAERAHHRPARLSGGEQQRIALARALAGKPRVLIADEPTGNLDPHTAAQVFNLLRDLAGQQGLALLMATHNHDLAAQMDRTVEITDGLLIETT